MRKRIIAFVSLVVVLLLSCHTVKIVAKSPQTYPAWDAYKLEEESARRDAGWTWEDGKGEKKTYSDLRKIVMSHLLWLQSRGKQGAPADFASARLNGASFIEEDLRKANFTSAKLHGVTFVHADLSEANLDYVDFENSTDELPGHGFTGARLRHAYLTGGRLSRVDFSLADLTDADFADADLQGASFRGAQLVGTSLRRAVLADADLWDVTFGGTLYEPRSSPNIRLLTLAKGIYSLTYDSDPAALADIRHEFKEHGYQQQEQRGDFRAQKARARRRRQRVPTQPLDVESVRRVCVQKVSV